MQLKLMRTQVYCVIWKMFLPESFFMLWKIEVENLIFCHDKYDLDFASSTYEATFLFDSWVIWPPEIWHCIFMTTHASQYVLWDHMAAGFCVNIGVGNSLYILWAADKMTSKILDGAFSPTDLTIPFTVCSSILKLQLNNPLVESPMVPLLQIVGLLVTWYAAQT